MKLMLPIFAFGLAAAGSASATTLTFSNGIAQATVPLSSDFTLSSFDTALGTLTGVEIMLTDTSTFDLQIYNSTNVSQLFTDASPTASLMLRGAGGVPIVDSVAAGPMLGTGTGASPFTLSHSADTQTVAVGAGQFASYETASPRTVEFTATSANGVHTGSGPTGV